MSEPKITREIAEAALRSFEEQKRHLEAQIAHCRSLLSGSTAPVAATPSAPEPARRGKRSAAVRARMAEAQRKRWAAIKGESTPAKKAPAEEKPKRKLSAEGRKRIIAATKKRWAAIRAAAAAATK